MDGGHTFHIAMPAGPFDQAAAVAICDAAETVAEASEARVVLLESGDVDFCRGLAPDFEPLYCGADPAAALAALSLPVVAVLRGEVASVGLELALAADIRLAADDSVLSLPDLAAGRLPCWGGTQRLVRSAGLPLATRMLLLGERIDAAEALGAGVVHRVAPAPDLTALAMRTAEELAALAPLALAYAKEAIREGAHLPLLDGLRLEADLNVLLQASTDREEGLDAFRNRRTPEFEGG